MDVSEQNELMQEVQEFLKKKFKDKPFHAVVTAEVSPGVGLEFSAGTISERSSLQAWKVIMNGQSRGNERLAQEFNKTSDIKFNNVVTLK